MSKGFKTGGRKAGTPNKATADIRAIAQQYAPEALEIAAEIMRSERTPPAAKIAAVNTILDRAYGKAPQALEHAGPNGGPIQLAYTDDERIKAMTVFLARTAGVVK